MHCISTFKKGALFIVASMLFFAACTPVKQTGLTDVDDNGGYASDASRIELANNDAISIADVAGNFYNAAYISTASGLGLSSTTVGTDTISIPHTLTIRFGNNDQVCLDGRKRRGTIIVSFNNQYNNDKETHTITFDHYFLNGNQLTGSIKTTRIDTTITGNWYYNILADDSLDMSPDPLQSEYIRYTANLVRKWVAGYASNERTDDVFSISGAATLYRPNNHNFSLGISTPLQFALNCDYAESGVVNVTGYNGSRILNYGDGNCDENAQLNIGVNVHQLTLTK
ncbi:MAG: hypothetical protein JWQ38_3558 [Flavipsychrobacter sp.]|nr:hypothetical protein [Flavipsychrobacter sp.]